MKNEIFRADDEQVFNAQIVTRVTQHYGEEITTVNLFVMLVGFTTNFTM